VLVFFSRLSVAKRGYVQRKMKLALDALQELPEGTIHTIPVRLDACEIPESFRYYHYANLFEPTGFDRIVRAIRTEVAKRSGPVARAAGQSVRDVSGHTPPEPDPSASSQPPKFLGSAQQSRWASVVPLVGLVIAGVSALVAVCVVLSVHEWLGIATPPARRE